MSLRDIIIDRLKYLECYSAQWRHRTQSTQGFMTFLEYITSLKDEDLLDMYLSCRDSETDYINSQYN